MQTGQKYTDREGLIHGIDPSAKLIAPESEDAVYAPCIARFSAAYERMDDGASVLLLTAPDCVLEARLVHGESEAKVTVSARNPFDPSDPYHEHVLIHRYRYTLIDACREPMVVHRNEGEWPCRGTMIAAKLRAYGVEQSYDVVQMAKSSDALIIAANPQTGEVSSSFNIDLEADKSQKVKETVVMPGMDDLANSGPKGPSGP